MSSTEERSHRGEADRAVAYHSLLKDFKDERRLMSVLSFMRQERLSIIQREISGMRRQLHGATKD